MAGSLSRQRVFLCLYAALALVGGCRRPDPNLIQGYVEGEFVYVASPRDGELLSLAVQRGDTVKTGELLFVLESDREQAARDEAYRRLREAQARLADARKGSRPSEIESLVAQLKQARSAADLAELEQVRLERLLRSGGAKQEEVDRARSTSEQTGERVIQLQADLKTAQLGAREDVIAAAEANVAALEAALTRAEWDLAQKRQTALQPAPVFDTLFREGEWVPAGRPVVVLLPPQNIMVRAFVSEDRISTVKVGDPVQVQIDGVPQPVTGKVRFVSPRAEFTPPVLYSRESRDKLVFMIEVDFDPTIAAQLHPGQPVDVRLSP